MDRRDFALFFSVHGPQLFSLIEFRDWEIVDVPHYETRKYCTCATFKMPAPTALLPRPEEVAEAAANIPLPAEGMRLLNSGLWSSKI